MSNNSIPSNNKEEKDEIKNPSIEALEGERMKRFKEIQKTYGHHFKDPKFGISKKEQKITKIMLNFDLSKNVLSLINKMIILLKKDQPDHENLFSVDLNIQIFRANLNNLCLINKIVDNFLSSVTNFQFFCQSEINENFQLIFDSKQYIVLMINRLRQVDKFEFICQDKLKLIDGLDNELCSSIEKAIAKATKFVFSNEQILRKGYSSHEICTIPGLLSKSITLNKDLQEVVLNFCFVGFKRQNREKFILSSLLNNMTPQFQFWPTSLTKIDINLNRLISFNRNIYSKDVKQFLIEFNKMISKQSQLKELSLDLTGIGYQGGSQIQQNYTELIELTQYLQTVNKLTLEVKIILIKKFIIINQSLNFQNNKIGGHILFTENEWNLFFERIVSIDNLIHLSLNVEYWKNFFNNQLTQQQQYNIIDRFINNLISIHQNNLQTFSFNTDDWAYLKQVNQIQLLKKISQFNNLIQLQLLFYKSKQKQQFNLLKQAQEYYVSIQQLTNRIGFIKRFIQTSKIVKTIKKVQIEIQCEVVKQVTNKLSQTIYPISNATKIISDQLQNSIYSIQEFEKDAVCNLINLDQCEKVINNLNLNQIHFNHYNNYQSNQIHQNHLSLSFDQFDDDGDDDDNDDDDEEEQEQEENINTNNQFQTALQYYQDCKK